MKRFLSLIVVLAMVIGMVPFGVFAADAGTYENPIEITDISNGTEITTAGQEEYYYSWTPSEDGSLAVSVNSEGAVGYYWWIEDVFNNDDNENSYTIESVKKDVPVIIGVGTDDAATVKLDLTFTPLPGTEGNPEPLDAEAENVLTIGAGETKFYQGKFGKMTMTLKSQDEEVELAEDDVTVYHNNVNYTPVDGVVILPCYQQDTNTPSIFKITNNTDAEANYVVTLAFTKGDQGDPDALVIGANTAVVAAGNNEGYYYEWTAEENGTLTVSVASEGGWTYNVNNLTAYVYGDPHTSADETVVNSEDVVVNAGDLVQVIVNSYDPANSYNAPGGTITVTASFAAGEGRGTSGGDEGGGSTDPVTGEVIASGTDVAVTVAAPATFTYTPELDGKLSITFSGTPGSYVKVMDSAENTVGLPKSAGKNVQKTESFDLVANETYTVTITGYDSTAWEQCAATVTYTATFTSTIDGGGEVEKAEYEISETALSLGENTVSLLNTAVTTIYVFEPAEAGIYTFTAPEGAILGYWGAGSWFLSDPHSTTNTCEWTCSSVGQTAYIGVSGVEDAFKLNVAKTGEYVPPYENVVYKNQYKETAKPYITCLKVTGSVTVGGDKTAVLGADGYFHLNDANGAILLLDTSDQDLALGAAYSNGGFAAAEYDDSGNLTKVTSYYDALGEYIIERSVINNGETTNYYYRYYPLNQDLINIIQAVGADPNSNWFTSSGAAKTDAADAWMFMCVTAELEHTPDEGVCSVCGAATGDEGGDTTCEHSEYAYADNGNGTHKITCASCKEVINASAAHTDADSDNACDLCSATISTEGGDPEVPDEGDVPAGTVYTYIANGQTWYEDDASVFAGDLNGASGDTEIKLYADIAPTRDITIQASANVTLDLNGHTISRSKSSGAVITVKGNLTILDTSAEGDGLIQNTATSSDRAVLVDGASATLTMKSGNLSATTQTVRADNGASFIFEGGTITATSYAIYVGSSCTATISGGTAICGAAADNFKYSLYCSGSATVSGVSGGYFYGRVYGSSLAGKLAGGYYTMSPTATYIASGYEVVDNDDATYLYKVQVVGGEVEDPAGSETNPIQVAMPAQLPSNVEIAAGKTQYYSLDSMKFDGMVLEVSGASAIILDGTTYEADEEGKISVTLAAKAQTMSLAIVNSGEAAATVTATAVYPVGSQNNPAELSIEMANYSSHAEGSQPYYYNWTAPADGTLTLEFYAEDADWNELGWFYVVNNMTAGTYGDFQWSDSDPVANPVTVEVAEGEVLEVQVNTYDPANPYGGAPAGDVNVTAKFVCDAHDSEETKLEDNNDGETHNILCAACGTAISNENHTYGDNGFCACGAEKAGTESNPISLSPMQLANGYEVTVPAGETVYFAVYQANGADVTVNGEVHGTVTGMSYAFSLTEGTYIIGLAYPEGTQMNPAELSIEMANYSEHAANSSNYYYKWTAPADGTLTLEVSAQDADGNELGWFYVVNNKTTGAYGDSQWSDSDPVVNPATVAVTEGDILDIQVNTYDPENPFGGAPAGEMYVTANFECKKHGETELEDENDGENHNHVCKICGTIVSTEAHIYNEDGVCACGAEKAGTENNPIGLSPMQLANGYQVTVPAGETVYFAVYQASGSDVTVNGEVHGTVTGMSYVFSLTEGTYTIGLAYPEGTQMNPAELVMGDNVSTHAAGSREYYYNWTAPADGTLTLNIASTTGWFYVVNNMSTGKYGDGQWSDSDPVVNPAAVEVAEGDEIEILVNTYDPASYEAPAGTVTVTAAFAPASVAVIGEVEYASVAEALAAAKSGDTVTMTADSNEANAALTIYPGVTLDLGTYTLTANYVVGLKNSCITGTTISADGKTGAKLIVEKDNVSLAAKIAMSGNYAILPVWNGDHYVFSLFYASAPEQITVSNEGDKVSLSFKHQASNYVQECLKNGSSAYGVSVIVRAEWTIDGANLSQEFVYTDTMVGNVSKDTSVAYSAEMSGCTSKDDLTISIMIVTDAGATYLAKTYSEIN